MLRGFHWPEFREYVLAQPSDGLAGTANTPCDCPIAKYLGGLNPNTRACVTLSGSQVIAHDETRTGRHGRKARDFIAHLDGAGTRQVTFGECAGVIRGIEDGTDGGAGGA